MMLPWRRVPCPIPKDRKGNDMYEAPPPSPPPSPPRRVNSKSKKGPKMMGSTTTGPSHSTKRETPKVKTGKALPSPALLGSTFATNIKGGEFAATPSPRVMTTDSPISPETPAFSQKNSNGISSNSKLRSTSNSARAANIRYPVFQPNFSPPEPPPPPPPPKNKYKVTLGIKPGASSKPSKKSSSKTAAPSPPPLDLLRSDCHSPQNDILRIQVLSDQQSRRSGATVCPTP
jgi:hypothetical protein